MSYKSRLFTYGTLTFQEVMIHLIGREIPYEKAKINGYSSFVVKGQNFPGLRKTTLSSSTNGIMYSNLVTKDWKILDQFEDFFYDRVVEEIVLEDGTHQKAFTYVVSPKFYHLLDSNLWDSKKFKNKSLSSFLDMIIGFDNK